MKGHFRLCLFVIAFVIVSDFITKRLVVDYLPLYTSQEIVLIKNFFGIQCAITHAINTGAAWGSFDQFPHVLLALRLILISMLIGYLYLNKLQKRYLIPLVLIIGGAIGNVIDFFLYGHVIDMIHCIFWGYDYPVFNIADSAICIGTVMLLFTLLLEKDKTSHA